MQEYVAGFAFSKGNREGIGQGTRVLMVKKNRPEWQAGLLNAIGGHIEPGESPYQAMVREFLEEVGMLQLRWTHYVTLTGEGFRVYFYYAYMNIDTYHSDTDEQIVNVLTGDMLWGTGEEALPNIPWLIAMARSMKRGERAKSFQVSEVYV